MTSRVFDERLKNHRRHVDVERVMIHVERHLEPVAKTGAFDREVRFEKLQLAAKRHLVLIHEAERLAKQLAKLSDEIGCLGVPR